MWISDFKSKFKSFKIIGGKVNLLSVNRVTMNLLTEKEDKKIHVFEVLIFSENIQWMQISRNSLQTPSLDHILLGNFTLSNSIIFVEDTITSNRDFVLFLIDH